MPTKKMSLPKHVTNFISKIDLLPLGELHGLTDNKRLEAAAKGCNLELAGKLYSGFALMSLKERMGHGNYMAGLAKHGIAPRTASRHINLVKLASRTPANVWPALSVIEPSKLALMCNWDNDELTQFFEGAIVRGITIEDAQTSSFRELEHRIKESRPESELEKKTNTLSKRLETIAMENIDLKKKLKNKKRSSPYPDFVETTRHESTALMEKAGLCFDDMEKMYQQLEEIGRTGKDSEHKRNWNIAATSLYHNLRGMIARSQKFLIELDSSLPADVIGQVSPAYYFNEDEITAAVQERELLIEQHTHEAVIRKNERSMKKPKCRGRPRTV